MAKNGGEFFVFDQFITQIRPIVFSFFWRRVFALDLFVAHVYLLHPNPDGFDLCIQFEGFFAHLGRNHFVCIPERSGGIKETIAIDPDCTCLHGVGETVRFGDIACQTPAARPYSVVLARLTSSSQSSKWRHGNNRTKDFPRGRCPAIVFMGENGRTQEITVCQFVAEPLATADNLSAARFAALDVAHDAVELCFSDDGADVDFVEAVADADAFGLLSGRRVLDHKRRVRRKARAGDTFLSGGAKYGLRCAFGGIGDVSVGKKMTLGDLPPSSRLMRFRLELAAAAMTFRPMAVDPVNATLSTSICS